MKIALIHKKYTTHGGTERYMVGLSKFLVQKGHEVHVITGNVDESSKAEGVIYHLVSAWGKHLGIDKHIFAKAAKKEVEKYNFDIIQSFSRLGFGDVIRIGGGCHQVFLYKYLSSLENKIYKFKKKIEYKLSLQDYFTRYYEAKDFEKGNYKKIVAVSQMVKDDIIKLYDVPADDIIVNHNGVNLEKFNLNNKDKFSQAIRKKHNFTKNDYVLLFLGTGFKRKGLKYVLEALKNLENAKLMIVGKGDIDKFKSKAEELSVLDRCRFIGPVREVEKYYAAADVFVFPSTYDPCANVTLEAMASGLPVITTEDNGASGVIDKNQNGYILEVADDVKKMVEYIKKLKNNKVRRTFSEQASAKMQNHSKKDNYQKMLDFYKKEEGCKL
ncbi:glycosyltransferase family 4 protein [Halanaerobium praevalens]|uniref:Glycosyl transferase group 1 n=1 Tax=Halanaerobium praevalens (strain ATCC 33744 / DSM 2228 / GSL) TaxID=572479 RepID=E3DN17_HALPG|nr:glycosyltransferase family 4 protein [Halanaerobium praevalens]ADO76423.1 glycosyl transferase group 1 [Halanaerobium praevalens DSM 2228]